MSARFHTALTVVLVLGWADPAGAETTRTPAVQGRKGTLSRLTTRLRLPARYRLARMRLKGSWAGKGLRCVSNQFGRACRNVRGGMTLLADRIELNVPTRLGKAFHKARNYSPMSLGTFAWSKLKKDPWFSTVYGSWSLGFSNLQLPLLIGMGVNPLLAGGIRLATGVPVDLGVLVWRQHYLRKKKDPSASFRSTLQQLGNDYHTFLEQRRQENRDFMAGRGSNESNLRRLSAPLTPPVANP